YRSPILPIVQLFVILIAMGVSRVFFIFISKNIYGLTNMSLIVMSISLLGATTDYCVFLIGDYLLQLKTHSSKRKALGETLKRTAKSIVISSISLAIGFSSLILAQLPTLKGMGIGGAIGFLSGMGVSLTVVPSILLLINKDLLLKWRFNMPKLKWGQYSATKMMKKSIKKPVRVITISMIAALIGISLFLVTPVDYAQLSSAPDRYLSKQGFDAMSNYMGEEKLNQIIVLFKSTENDSFINETDELNFKSIDYVVQIINNIRTKTEVPYVYGISHPLGNPYEQSLSNSSYFVSQEIQMLMRNFILPDSTLSLVILGSQYKEGDKRLDEQIDLIRSIIKEEKKNLYIEDWKIYVTGFPVGLSDGKRTIQTDFALIFVFIMVTMSFILWFFLRDIFMSFRILLTILISIGISLGIFSLISYIFLNGMVYYFVPIFLFSILTALGLDFDILFLGIYLRLYKKTGDIENSIISGVSQTMTNISIAGIIMAVTYFSLIFTASSQMIQLGVGLGLGILVDVFISRIFIVPTAVILTTKLGEKAGRRKKSKESRRKDEK
ncbi:MAG: MMPL family transporter, partial [Candidatus Heimdallarchaeaceae archaeon]